MLRALLALRALVACAPQSDSIEEGCSEELAGAEYLGDTPPTLIERLNCHRTYLGLWQVGVNPRIQEATDAHLGYLAKYDALSPESEIYEPQRAALLRESRELAGSYGASPLDRMVNSGAISFVDLLTEAGVWGWPILDPPEEPDRFFDNPYVREFAFQPGLQGVGLAIGTVSDQTFGYMDAVASVPSGSNTNAPIVYPKDGQTDVPTSFRDVHAFGTDPLNRTEPWGYPITLTVSTWENTSDVYDPFTINVGQASLKAEDGQVIPITVVEPSVFLPMSLRTTVVVLPNLSLKPDTTYELSITIDTVAQPYDVLTRFTTRISGI